jgi:hypothetical protein
MVTGLGSGHGAVRCSGPRTGSGSEPVRLSGGYCGGGFGLARHFVLCGRTALDCRWHGAAYWPVMAAATMIRWRGTRLCVPNISSTALTGADE